MYICTEVSSARVEGDFSTKDVLFDKHRIGVIGNNHAVDEMVISWNMKLN